MSQDPGAYGKMVEKDEVLGETQTSKRGFGQSQNDEATGEAGKTGAGGPDLTNDPAGAGAEAGAGGVKSVAAVPGMIALEGVRLLISFSFLALLPPPFPGLLPPLRAQSFPFSGRYEVRIDANEHAGSIV